MFIGTKGARKVEFMSKKVDFFKADKAMSERVAQFMRVKVWNITLKARLEKEVKDNLGKIENLKELAPSTGKDYSEDIAILEGCIESAQKKYEQAVKDAEKFEYTEGDKTFYKAYADGKQDNADAVIEWFAGYGLEVDAETNIVEDIVGAIAGARKLGGRAVVRAEAKKFTDDVRTKNDVLTVFYGKLAEGMMTAGTLKAEEIPEDVREYYAVKKVKKASK